MIFKNEDVLNSNFLKTFKTSLNFEDILNIFRPKRSLSINK